MRLLTEKVRAGRYLMTGYIYEDDGKLLFRTPYNKELISEIKALQGARWDPKEKTWSCPLNERNFFAIQYLMNNDPYARFRDGKVDIELHTKRDLRANQIELVKSALANRLAIWSAEPGLGKSLCFIEVAEHLKYLTPEDVWYVGPKAGVVAVTRELSKWQSPCRPRMLTYEGFTKVMHEWVKGQPAPKLICFDESQKLKDPGTQRSRAAYAAAKAVRMEHTGYVILMTGTPSPKDPADWWHQCEVACPGYLKEGDIHKFRRRYALIVQTETEAGSTFPKLITWWNNPEKCQTCGQLREVHSHFMEDSHVFAPSLDEVGALHRRLKGLVTFQFKKDYNDLPEKQYEIIRLKPSVETIRTVRLIQSTEPRAVTKLIKLRELSDGFQYTKIQTGTRPCDECHGQKKTQQFFLKEGLEAKELFDADDYEERFDNCQTCGGTGEVEIFEKQSISLKSPKQEYFVNDLEAYSEIGRYLVWGGFTETVDMLVDIACGEGWHVLRIDGRGYHGFTPQKEQYSANELLDAMDRSHPRFAELQTKIPRLCVVGHPRAGGVALTLTATPVELYFSNDFSGEARMQSEDRAHRIGMDANRGLVIKDLIHLPTDKLVLDNLQKKKDLQSITTGEIDAALKVID
jgi:hypothetical protein